MVFKRLLLFFVGSCLLSACAVSEKKEVPLTTDELLTANRLLLEVAMEDGFPPPIASRVYVYPHIAHYITLHHFYPDSLPPLYKKLNDFPEMPQFENNEAVPQLTALLAFCKVGKKVVFSEQLFKDHMHQLKTVAAEKGISPAQIKASEELADSLTFYINQWIDKDQYIETRTFDRYTSSKGMGTWKETPPDYIPGMEPYWQKIRPLVIDSASIYKADGYPSFDIAKDSPFYAMVNDVYTNSKTLDSVKTATAWFWDDNPNVSTHQGHLVTMQHKISPPGHWLHIVSQVTKAENSSYFTTTQAYTFTAIAMFDGIISCWHEKFRTNLIRPVTYIQEHIDVTWQPLIQTPPFPEFPSGHSVISASAATVLTSIFGESYAFTDATQEIFGIPARSFTSFDDAAWEVSLSRYYGGIHYKNAIEEGYQQGNFIGKEVLSHLTQTHE